MNINQYFTELNKARARYKAAQKANKKVSIGYWQGYVSCLEKYKSELVQEEWFSEMIKPEVDKWVIVRDEDGKEYDYHAWNGHCWYAYIVNDDNTCDGYRSDVDIAVWKY